MSIFFDNFNWMFQNIFLALSGVFFCALYLKSKKIALKFTFLVLWVLFVPNSIYLVTDIQHLPAQFSQVDLYYKFLIGLQFIAIFLMGIITYFASVFPMEVEFKDRKVDRIYLPILLFLFNFFIAFAVALGKTERTHSWYIFLNQQKFLQDIFAILNSIQTMFFVVMFGLVLNILYFYFSRRYRSNLNKILKI